MQAFVVKDWPSTALLDMADALVIYSSPGAEICLSPEHGPSFQKALERGMGLMAIHWATAVYARNEAELGTQWMEALGGYWVHPSGVELDELPINQVDKSHPITRGWEDFKLKDEFFLQPKIGPSSTVLLETKVNDSTLPVAWYTERADGGRSFGTTLGNFAVSFQMSEFRQFLLNASLWVARKDGRASLSYCPNG